MTPEPDKRELERRLADERRAAAEAATAEAEPDAEPEVPELHEDEVEPEPDVEPEAEVEQGMTDEQRAKQLGRTMDRFELELRELFGEAEALTPCPMDGALGFMVPGMLELKVNEKYKRCPVCNGHGAVLTGSIAEGKQTADCPRCGARGYLEKIEQGETQSTEPTNGNGEAAADDGYGVPAWMGNPNIGATP